MSRIIVGIMFLFATLSLAISQEDMEPFGDLEEEIVIEEKIEIVEEEDLTITPDESKDSIEPEVKIYKDIKSPRTYLSITEYNLRGVVIAAEVSYAIIGTEDIIDQVLVKGDLLGQEEWELVDIMQDNVLFADPINSEETFTLYLSN